MARNIYSFVKIRNKQTYRGIFATIMGVVSICCLVGMLAWAFKCKGELPSTGGSIAYLSLIIGVVGLWISVRLRKDTEAYGKMIHSAFYVNVAAVLLHGIIFLIGCFVILM